MRAPGRVSGVWDPIRLAFSPCCPTWHALAQPGVPVTARQRAAVLVPQVACACQNRTSVGRAGFGGCPRWQAGAAMRDILPACARYENVMIRVWSSPSRRSAACFRPRCPTQVAGRMHPQQVAELDRIPSSSLVKRATLSIPCGLLNWATLTLQHLARYACDCPGEHLPHSNLLDTHVIVGGGPTPQQLAEQERVQAAQDGGQRLLLQQRHMPARGRCARRQQRPLHALRREV